MEETYYPFEYGRRKRLAKPFFFFSLSLSRPKSEWGAPCARVDGSTNTSPPPVGFFPRRILCPVGFRLGFARTSLFPTTRLLPRAG